jgi:ankyrin repeat protein
MKKRTLSFIFLPILSLFFSLLFSCERHEQQVIVPPPKPPVVNELSKDDAIFVALYQKDYNKLKELLETGNYDVNEASEEGKLLINAAVGLDELFIGELLISFNADPTLLDGEGLSAFNYIEKSTFIEEWKIILSGESLSLDYMTEKSFEIMSETAVDKQLEKIALLKLYFDRGVDLNTINEDNNTLLMIATSKKLPLMIDFLCTFEGLDPNLFVVIEKTRRRQVTRYNLYARFYADEEDKYPEVHVALDRCGAGKETLVQLPR